MPTMRELTSKMIIPTLSHSTPREFKRFAKEHAWKIALLPKEKVKLLQDETSIRSEEWFNTTGAATYCLCQACDPEKDWHTVLKENRRKQNDSVAVLILGKEPRGNAERLGELECHTVGRKVYYTKSALDKWLAGMKSFSKH
ncbi:hypothetical protein ACMXYO_01115 [Neptuniibacter sp. QD37_6]|uniref:hypothetical protein n=1 Tax=Neptuniibacter sp. QD37_6 TaxID=3398210 RepID=UPI0039F6406C